MLAATDSFYTGGKRMSCGMWQRICGFRLPLELTPRFADAGSAPAAISALRLSGLFAQLASLGR